ncbi:MAG: serine hydrolase domain-containing protein [Roseobacter sp.]
MVRRQFIAGAASCVVWPVHAQTTGWDAVVQAAAQLEQCHALLIHRGGQAVVSEIYRGPSIGRAVPIKSVSKTIVAALTGTAVDRGEIPSVHSTIGALAPQLIPDAADPRVESITLEYLLTMQAGLERTSGANYGEWVSSPDWIRNALARPFVTEPGTQMLYSTGSYHVLGAILSEVSGQSLLRLARERLGLPLGIDIPAWTRDPQGYYLGGNEMSLSLPAMVRFGEMYRQNGYWDGARVLSKQWVTQSFRPLTRSRWSGLQYGYGWFLGQSGGDRFALARGYGGQVICVVPDLALSIALTSDPTRPARSGGYFGDLMRLIEDFILPTARRDAA